MKKSELVTLVADAANMPKVHTETAIDALCDVIAESLAQGEEINLPGIGMFKIVERAACNRHNPKTGEKFEAPAYSAVKFKASAPLKNAVRRRV